MFAVADPYVVAVYTFVADTFADVADVTTAVTHVLNDRSSWCCCCYLF